MIDTSKKKLSVTIANTLLMVSKTITKILTKIGMIGAWLSIPLIGIIIFDIITRRFLVLGSTKLQEMEWHLHTMIFLLALGFAYTRNAHVRIEVVREKFSQEVKSWLEILGCVLFLIPYTIMIIYFGLDFVERSFNLNEVSSALTGLSHRWIIKSFVPVGMILLWLGGCAVLLRNIAFIIGLETQNKMLMEDSTNLSPELSSPEPVLENLNNREK